VKNLSFLTHRIPKNTIIPLLLCTLILSACNMPGLSPDLIPGEIAPVVVEDAEPITTPLPPPPETIISFTVKIPTDTPLDDPIYLNILDEVTGLALNVQSFLMEIGEPPEDGETTGELNYRLELPFAIGSVIKYRYSHLNNSIQLAEHASDGGPVRYRLFHVDGPGSTNDVVTRWTDTTFEGPTGRIMGQAMDAQSGSPIPNLLVTAGGIQTLTRADGNFYLEGLPPGTHNLVAYALDGTYRAFQQGALVASESTTPAPISLAPVRFVNVLFVASVPDNTPPIIPLRLAGNLFQLGNTFANLTGDVNGMVLNMPVTKALPDGRYLVTLRLPVGADIRYKYTLGDGFWNAEHTGSGEFNVRQIIVPDHESMVEDHIATWYDGAPNALTFDLTVPENTPPGDFVSIQFNPLIGWTESIPMWHIGGARWAYVLYSPLNLPGNFNYRFCRNNQCGYADDALTPGRFGAGRPVKMGPDPQLFKDQVVEWASLYADPSAFEIPPVEINQRGKSYWAGIELEPNFHPSWMALLPGTLDQIQKTGANNLVLSPTWTFGQNIPGNNPPILAPLPGSDALWPELISTIQQSKDRGLKVALFPKPRTLIEIDEWWQSATLDDAWWSIWFDQYRAFSLHHARLAAATEATSLILGGYGLSPALPGGVLADGTASGVPEDVENRWRALISEVRTLYHGNLLWAIPHQDIDSPPAFLDSVDGIYLLLEMDQSRVVKDLGVEVNQWLDYSVWTFQILSGKPLILAVSYPSDPSMGTQFDAYSTLLDAANQRDWISGFVSRDFYPPAALQDQSASIHGKPTTTLLGTWFPQMLGAASP